MFADKLRQVYTNVSSKGVSSKTDPTFIGIVFMAFVCAVLPLDISQLSFAVIGAVFYAFLQKSSQDTLKKKPVSLVVNTAQRSATSQLPKERARSFVSTHTKPLPGPSTAPVRNQSAQPIVAPTFRSDGWEGEVQELLLQITPTAEAERIVNELARVIKQTMQAVIPEIEVVGFVHGNLTFGKAFGVAVPEVDIIAKVSPQVLFHRLHGRNTPCTPSHLDVKKLQKSAIRACADRLVASGGFKFRRSSFKLQEPKVTLLAPASLGLFSESIPIDFSVNIVTPLYNAALLTECCKIDSRAQELILIVRRWAKDRGICHLAKGHLSPYMWGLLTIYFLQVGVDDEGPLLPPLEQFELPAELVKGRKTTSSALRQSKWKPTHIVEAKKSAATLFMEFVHFYETQFNWSNEAVSIRASQRKTPSLGLPLHIIVSEDSATSQQGPSIEDPFSSAHNLGDHMTFASFARLKEELSRAEALCLQAASLTELLEPWVPADAGEMHNDDEQAAASKPLVEFSAKGEDWRRDAKQAQSTVTVPWRRSGGEGGGQAQARMARIACTGP